MAARVYARRVKQRLRRRRGPGHWADCRSAWAPGIVKRADRGARDLGLTDAPYRADARPRVRICRISRAVRRLTCSLIGDEFTEPDLARFRPVSLRGVPSGFVSKRAHCATFDRF